MKTFSYLLPLMWFISVNAESFTIGSSSTDNTVPGTLTVNGKLTSTSPTFNTSITLTNSTAGTKSMVINGPSGASADQLDINVGGTLLLGVNSAGDVFGHQNFLIGSAVSGSTGSRIKFVNHVGGTDDSAVISRADGATAFTFHSGGGSTPYTGFEWPNGSFMEDESINIFQFGKDVASPSNQTLKAADGLGTDKSGANLTLEGGQSTGTGTSGAVDISTAMTGENSGSTANLYNIRAHYKSKFVALTDATTNEVIRFSLPANKVLGGEVVVTTYATNSTPHLQCRTTVLAFQAIAVGTAITPTIDVVKAGTLAADSGTMSETFTIVDNGGNTFSIIDNVDSDLTSSTDRCKVVVTALNGNAAVTITDP